MMTDQYTPISQYNFSNEAYMRHTSEKTPPKYGQFSLDVYTGMLEFKSSNGSLPLNVADINNVKITRKFKRGLPVGTVGLRIKYNGAGDVIFAVSSHEAQRVIHAIDMVRKLPRDIVKEMNDLRANLMREKEEKQNSLSTNNRLTSVVFELKKVDEESKKRIQSDEADILKLNQEKADLQRELQQWQDKERNAVLECNTMKKRIQKGESENTKLKEELQATQKKLKDTVDRSFFEKQQLKDEHQAKLGSILCNHQKKLLQLNDEIWRLKKSGSATEEEVNDLGKQATSVKESDEYRFSGIDPMDTVPKEVRILRPTTRRLRKC